jgi:uncharacterized membrane protein
VTDPSAPAPARDTPRDEWGPDPAVDEAVALALAESPEHRRSRLGLAALMVGAGVLHFVVPKMFDQIIPRPLGRPRFWTVTSGMVEIACGVLLANRSTERIGGAAAAVTIIAVYPANIKAALDAGPPTNPVAAFTWLRLPMQLPLFRWAVRHAQA